MKIAFLTIATNKYNIFADILSKSLDKYCKLLNFDLFVFGNSELSYKPLNFNIHTHYITHTPHPVGTLLRYNYYLEKKNELEQYDYLYHIDCDMQLVSNVGDEILGDRVCTLHPGWFLRHDIESFEYDRNPTCKAFVDVKDPRVKPGCMYQNCFKGGNSHEFIKMASSIRNDCEIDLRNNIVARWHDESYMNKYMLDNPPTKLLSPGYAYPEKWNLQVEKKIVHLDKDHLNIRKSD
jgi:hypothetical protein